MAMENSKVRNGNGKYSLPPKTPFPTTTTTSPFLANTNTQTRSKPKYRVHQRTSSESLVIEEQPSWLDELLDEPESPLHRRSSSETSASLWGSQDFVHYKDTSYGDKNQVVNNNNRVWDSSQQTLDSPNTKSSASETDTKHSKQQFAQRSRVRKLQYIADLERNVQVLQAEGSEVSGELKFLNQRSLILTMENKALKQRLQNLAQEQLIKYLEHEVLEREIGRLRSLYKQQQQPQAEKPHFSHRRTTSMESQFANISLKNKESFAVRDGLF